jgi:hypothetical protein
MASSPGLHSALDRPLALPGLPGRHQSVKAVIGQERPLTPQPKCR